MKKWSMITKKMTVLFLGAMLISVMMPEQAKAQEQCEQDGAAISVQSGNGAEQESAESADDMTSGEKTMQAMKVQSTGTGKETEDLDNADDVEDNEKDQDDIGTDDNTGRLDDDQNDGQQAEDPTAFPILMDSSNELYGSLSRFLSLSADQFQIYTAAVMNPVTGQPVQPESPVEVSLDVPSGYDTDRVVVSEISMDGETPVRTELSFTYDNGKAVFETDHSGIYVVMEKKVQEDLPASLEMTSKVEKLELTKKYADRSSASPTAADISMAVNPQTGDDNSVLIWGAATAIAAAAVIALVVIIIKRRK